VVYRRICGTPVFVQLQAACARQNLFLVGGRKADISFAEETRIHDHAIRSSQHGMDMPGPWSTGGCRSTHRGTRAPSQHGGNAIHHGIFLLLRADEVNVAVDSTCSKNRVFASDDFGSGSYGHGHVGLDIWIASLA